MELFNTSVGRLVLQTWLLLALTHHKFCPLLYPFSFFWQENSTGKFIMTFLVILLRKWSGLTVVWPSWCGLTVYEKKILPSNTCVFFRILRNFQEHLFYRTPLDDRFYPWQITFYIHLNNIRLMFCLASKLITIS